jgi:hypothetical protein
MSMHDLGDAKLLVAQEKSIVRVGKWVNLYSQI